MKGELRPKMLDCSGLVRTSIGSFRIELPHNALRKAGWQARDPVPTRSGDLFLQHRAATLLHVGIFLGDNRFITRLGPYGSARRKTCAGPTGETIRRSAAHFPSEVAASQARTPGDLASSTVRNRPRPDGTGADARDFIV